MPTVTTDDIETFYDQRGDGPPVVFVHGMFMTTAMWDPQLTALADSYTTIAYDVRGHGYTGGSARPSYSILDFAVDLEALFDALDIDRAVVCGLSMGGAIAQAFAAANPDRLAGLVLADTFPAGRLPLVGRVAMANIRFLSRLDRVVGYKTLNRWQIRVGNRLLPGVASAPETLISLVEDAPTIPHDELVKIADATAAFSALDLDLSDVTAPALVMHGEHLPMANERVTARLVAQLPNADPTVAVVPDSGHASNVDNPSFFTARLREFLAERAYSDVVSHR